METLKEFASSLSGTIWGWGPVFPLLVIVLLGTGFVTTFGLRWIQIRQLKHSLDVIRGRYDNPAHEGDITHFQALSTALSATVGIGNIAGVATAIHYGGPGALFWMWVTAVFGMALKYAECTLSMRYRVIHEDGSASGGPMYYIERGLGRKWVPLAVFFAACTVVSSFGSGNSVQAFTVADQLRNDLGIQTWITGLVMATLVALVILGGIKRIGRVTSRLAPFMAIVYVAGGLLVLMFNWQRLPGVFGDILASAFRPAAQLGGFAGGSFIFMLTWGVKRGLFSNESGQGSAPIAHAAARTDEPVREGVVAMVGPLVDTLIICTITGLVILTTGVWKDRAPQSLRINAQSAFTVVSAAGAVGAGGQVADADLFDGTFSCQGGIPEGVAIVRNHSLVEDPLIRLGNGDPYEGAIPVVGGTIDFSAIRDLWLDGKMMQNGSPLTAWAFRKGLSPLGDWGHLVVTFGVFLFALSTAISWSYYGDRAIVYLFGRRYVFAYKVVYCVIHYLGAVFALEVVWNFGDSALGLMAFPNLIALLLLLPATREMTREYFSRKHVPYR